MIHSSIDILAQDSGAANVLIWALLLIVLVVLLFAAVEMFKRWLRRETGETGEIGGFTLADLRRLHREGKMNDEEFEATRQRLVSTLQAQTARNAHETAAPQGEPKIGGTARGSDNNTE